MDYSIYEAYEKGYNNGIQFGYIPDLNGAKEVSAYCLGLNDAKANKPKKSFEELEKEISIIK